METEGFTEWNDSVKATAASAEPQTPMKIIANHSRAEMFLRFPQLKRRMGIAIRAEMMCSPRTMKLELSPCVRCVRKGASVAQSAAAINTRAGRKITMERRGVMIADILHYFLKCARACLTSAIIALCRLFSSLNFLLSRIFLSNVIFLFQT